MTTKSSKQVRKPLAAVEPANGPAGVHPVGEPTQNRQRAGLSRAVAAETQAVKPPETPTPAAAPPKLLTPLVGASRKATPPGPPQLPEKTAVAEKVATHNAAQTVKVPFVLFEPGAKHVTLCGDFNGWASHTKPMKRDAGGHWETTLALSPGRYEYKFVVDGQWIPDPLAREHVCNDHGTLNSVVEVLA